MHRNTWTGWNGANPVLANNYSLAGAGLGVNLTKSGGEMLGSYSVKAFFATTLGSNRGQDASGKDSDNTRNSSRFWLQANKWF